MRKLKLESLQVESFETTSTGSHLRGTVQGHGPEVKSRGCPDGTGPSNCLECFPVSYDGACEPETYDVKACGDTMYFDCTLGCSQYNTCEVCWIEKTKRGCQID
jgi:hypothetical protein